MGTGDAKVENGELGVETGGLEKEDRRLGTGDVKVENGELGVDTEDWRWRNGDWGTPLERDSA